MASSSPASGLEQAAPVGAGAAVASQVRAVRAGALTIVGAGGLCAVVAAVFLLVAGAAAGPSVFVPARTGGWPHWMAGPLQGLHLSLGPVRFELLTALMAAGYLAALGCARRLPAAAIGAAIVAAHLILLLGPPLISQDVFGYLAFARMGALHGLDPYAAVAAQAPHDPILPFIGWPGRHSPYGPLFTLLSYGAAPLGLGGGIWALKALAVASSLGAVALLARAAAAAGRSARTAAAFLGLNPVLLELAVGGAHNDTLVILLVAAALLLTAGAARYRAATAPLAAAVGVKITGGLALPFLMLAPRHASERRRVALAAALSLAAVALLGAILFGSHMLGFFNEIGAQQRQVAVHSIPAETARLLGLPGAGLHSMPSWWRRLFQVAFVAVLMLALWRTARGADWRSAAGWTTVALVVCTGWLLPWYAIWPLPFAVLAPDRRLRVAALCLCLYALVIHIQLTEPLLGPY